MKERNSRLEYISFIYLFEAYSKCCNCSTSNLWRETNTSRCLSPSYCQSSVTERCIHFRFLFSFNLSKSPVINSFGWVWPSLLMFLKHPFYHLFHIAILTSHMINILLFSFQKLDNNLVGVKFSVKVWSLSQNCPEVLELPPLHQLCYHFIW